jgi:hypothetical protein
MNRLDKIKSKKSARRLDVLLDHDDQEDCIVNTSHIFNGHTLGASISKENWRIAIKQFCDQSPSIPTSKAKSYFMIATDMIAGMKLSHKTLHESKQVRHILSDDDRYMDAACELEKYAEFQGLIGTSLNVRLPDHTAFFECERIQEAASRLKCTQVSSDAIRNVVLLFQENRAIEKFLPIRKVSCIFEILPKIESRSTVEAEKLRKFHELAQNIGAAQTLFYFIDHAIAEGLLRNIFDISHIEIDGREMSEEFDAMLRTLSMSPKDSPHDAESD